MSWWGPQNGECGLEGCSCEDHDTQEYNEDDMFYIEMLNFTRQWMRGAFPPPPQGMDFEEALSDQVPKYWDGDLPDYPSPEKAKKEAKELSHKVFSSYNLLHQIVVRHEPTIQKRWIKKTRQQRLQILRKAWPNMPEQHRPDWKAYDAESQKKRDSIRGSDYKDWFMWPQINQEDLTQPKLMLLFLNSRGRNIPPIFAAADWETMYAGQTTAGLNPPFIHKHTMIMNGTTTPEEYGKIVEWNDDNFFTVQKWADDGQQFLPGEGLLILRAQVRILDFLLDFCRQIVHEIPPDDLISDAYPVQPEPSLQTGVDESGHSSMATMALEATYKVPLHIDIDRIASLLEAQTSEVTDHVWSLREDPEYFRRVLLEKKEHSYEVMVDGDGQIHPLARKTNEDKFWGTMVTRIAAESYKRLEAMTILHRQARDLSKIEKRYRSRLDVTDELPEEYRNALYRFRFFLRKAIKDTLKDLYSESLACPPMRRFWVRDPGSKPCGDKDCNCMGGHRCTFVERKDYTTTLRSLLFIFELLYRDADGWTRQSVLIDELERLLKSSTEANSLVSSYLYEKISYVSVLSQCMKQIELYQPWARHYHYQTRGSSLHPWRKTHDYTDEHEAALKPLNQMIRVIRGGHISLDKLGRVANPSGGKFKYPFEKRRNRDTVNALRQAEANLDAVWAELDGMTKANTAQYKDLAAYRLLSQRSLRRTAEWVEPEKTKNKGQPSTNEDLWFLNRPLSNLFLGESEQPRIEKPTKKTKAKTKGEPAKAPNGSITVVEIPEPETVDKQPTFQVDARALKVFRTLFFNPEVTSSPGEIAWNDFLHAMGSTGFQIEKLYGSVWQFQPTDLDVERGIHFHEPHPKGKIDFQIARRHGRRLARTYGWHGGMFALKKK